MALSPLAVAGLPRLLFAERYGISYYFAAAASGFLISVLTAYNSAIVSRHLPQKWAVDWFLPLPVRPARNLFCWSTQAGPHVSENTPGERSLCAPLPGAGEALPWAPACLHRAGLGVASPMDGARSAAGSVPRARVDPAAGVPFGRYIDRGAAACRPLPLSCSRSCPPPPPLGGGPTGVAAPARISRKAGE
jgi:hypothetical protein